MKQLWDIKRTELLDKRSPSMSAINVLKSLSPHPLLRLQGASIPELLARRCQQAMEMCEADAAGISVFTSADFSAVSWLVAVGSLRQYTGHQFPRDDSPCEVSCEYQAPQLFLQPHEYFASMRNAGIVMQELLVVPITGPCGGSFGTIWSMTNNPTAHFCRTHVGVLQRLSVGVLVRIQDHLRELQ